MRTLYIFRVLLVALLLAFGKSVSAQTYSVQTTLIPSAPHYNYLSHLADQNQHLQVMLTLLDFNNPPINVRLRVRVEGPGYVLYTNPNVTVGQPLTLESGIPLFLTDLDLQPYFHESNLIVSPSGLDINNLPEGYTSVCVDVVLDGTNQEVISSNNCTGFQLTRFKPPFTSFPNCESVIDTNEMFLSFNWTDPVGYIPDGNSYMEHTFTLHRWYNPNNNSVFQTGEGYVTDVVTTAPMVNLPLFDLQLEQGGLYVWRVQSRIFRNNGAEVHMIENSGISMPCTFYFGEPQTLADVLTDGLYIDLDAASTSDIKGKAWWEVIDNTPNQGLDDYDKFLVEYRRQPTGNETYQIPWFADTVIDTLDFIYQLEPSTTYEIKVSGIVGNTISDPTPVKTFTTQDPRQYACGDSDMPFMPFNWQPLENAQAGIQVQIGQFMLHTTELQAVGGIGHYSGKGTIPIPFLMGAKAKVTFDDILIDTEYMVRDGRVDVVTKGLENWLHEQYSQFVDPIYVNGVIDSAYVDSNGVAWAVVDGVAYEYPFDPPDYPIVLNDENGNQYTIYPNDSIEVSSYVAISEEWDVDPDEVAVFSQNANENRGFDPKEHMQWHENYEIMRLADSSLYFVANKSMAEGESDVVNVELPQGTQASFQLADGTPITSSPAQGWMGTPTYQNGVQYTLNLPVMPSTGNYSLHVFANNQKVGELNIVVYSEKQKELIVVPLVANLSVTESDIKNKLDQTLGEANINIDVTLAPQWNDTLFTPTKSISLPTEVGLLNKYSEDMRDLRDAYFDANPSADKSKYYLFLVSGFDDPSELGYMVRGRAMGFVKANQPDLLNTIAHELGHGMGALEHTWKGNGPDRGTTSGLMDYEENQNQLPKNNLTKAEWKELRDLDILPSLFDDVDDYMNEIAALDFDSIIVETPPTGAVSIEASQIPVDKALMVGDGTLVRFSSAARSRFTHFQMYNGKVIGLMDGSVKLEMVTKGYESEDSPNTVHYDRVVQNEVGLLVFFRMDTESASARVHSKALKGTTIIEVVTGFASGDVTQIEFVDCNEVGGQYVTNVNNQGLVYGQTECPNEGECASNDLIEITDSNKKAIKDAFRSIILSANGGFNWNPIRFVGNHNHVLDVEDQRVLKEKIRTLNHYRNDIVVGTIVMKGSFNQLYTQTTADQLINDVVSELSSEFPSKKLVLFFAHYITGSQENLFTTDHYTCVTTSFAANDGGIVNPVFTTDQLSLGSNVMNNFMLLFTEIRKPFYLTNIYEKYDGNIVSLKTDKTANPQDDSWGYPYIHGAKNVVSIYRNAYNQYQIELREIIDEYEVEIESNEISLETLQEWVDLQSSYAQQFDLWEEEDLVNPNHWVDGAIKFDDLKEHYLTENIAKEYYKKKSSDCSICSDIQIWLNGSSEALSESMYYDFNVWDNVIDPIVYNVIDVVGSIPVVDIFADAAGLIYATARGDAHNATIYGASLVVPFAGAGSYKLIDNTIAYYAKKNSNATYEIVVKHWNDNLDGWTKISDDIPVENNAIAAKNYLESQKDELDDAIVERVVRIKNSSNLSVKEALLIRFEGKSNVVDWINELGDNPTFLKKLKEVPLSSINTLNTELPLLKSAFNNDLELLTSWTRLGDSPIRIDLDYLNGIKEYPKSWSFSFNGTSTTVLKADGSVLASLYTNKIVAAAGSPGNWNELLNKVPVKNQAYHVDDYIFETDSYRRVKKVTGELENIERGRNNYQQGISVQLKDGTQGVDDGGHLIANILNGPGEQINYLPQIANLNRGEWKAMENTLVSALQSGKQVEIEIIPIFNGSSKRPTKFEVEYWIDGEYEYVEFYN